MVPLSLIEKLQNVKHLVVLTGAGVSAESGVPTFRDALTGLWANYNAERLASETGFLADPALVWGWYEWRRRRVLHAQPNLAHTTIAQLAIQVPELTLITQNVDDLHERAGSKDVIHLHGSLHQPRCFICETAYVIPEETVQDIQLNQESSIEPPRCSLCGEPVRPGVVWFGEQLPAKAWQLAQRASQYCDLLMIIGTSGLVWPAANLPYLANQAGIPIVQINPEKSSFNSIASYNLCGKAGELLPQLYTAAFTPVG